ncbi:MAG: hypothetical protein WCH77_01915 [Planctomycetota bacterium]|jgi:hypothetical protein
MMARGFLSTRIDETNRLHHLWSNNGTWWVHYTLHWDHRKRRIRRSLKTGEAIEAIARRDAIFARIAVEGEEMPERKPPRIPRANEGRASFAAVA